MMLMEYAKRKHPRLKSYDYSLPGNYYVTIHLHKDAPRFSYIEQKNPLSEPAVILNEYGNIAKIQLFDLEARYSHVKIDKYVIMPTHIHAILQLTDPAGASPRPTLMDVIGTYKSLTTRAINQRFHTTGRKIFQTSFYETVLRSDAAYLECWRYIDENPAKWLLDPDDL